MENNDVIKLNTEKELVVNVESIEDLLNSIKFASNKLKEAKEGLEMREIDKDYAAIKRSLDLVLENSNNVRHLDLPNFEKQLQRGLEGLPKEDTIKALLFEVERFQGVDVLFKKMRTRNIIISSLIAMIVTISAIGYSGMDDKVLRIYHHSQLQKTNFVLPKTQYELVSNKNGIATFKKINK